MVTFSVVIGSAGRPSLKLTLDTLAPQVRPGDEVIIGFDSHRREVDLTLANSYPFVKAFAYDAGYSWYGVEQVNEALKLATGTHVFTLGDDDCFTERAFDVLRPLCEREPERPVLYRFLCPAGYPMFKGERRLLWDEPRMLRSHISGCCIAAPRRFVPPMPTKRYVEHDFDWIQAILDRAAQRRQRPVWLDFCGVIARPEDKFEARGIWQCWACDRWSWLKDFSVIEHPYCPKCGMITDINSRLRIL